VWPFTLPGSTSVPSRSPYPFGGPEHTSTLTRVSSACLWSTVYIPPGPLAQSNARLFDYIRGQTTGSGRTLTLSDTNLRESGRRAGALEVAVVEWSLRSVLPTEPLVELAQALREEDDIEEIKQHGVLQFDLSQALLDIGPLWLNRADIKVLFAAMSPFSVNVAFDPSAPVLNRELAITVFLNGLTTMPVEIG